MKKNVKSVPEIRFPGFTDLWKERKLGDVCSRVQGNDGRMELPTLTISAANGWMKQEDRFSGNIAGKEQKNYTLLHKGELSYNHGNSKLAKYGTVFSLQTYEEALVPRVYHSFKVEIGNADFIEYYFATKIPDRELKKLISSGARMDGLLNIGYNDFMGIKIMLPSTSEQVKIAEYFRSLDYLITLHQRELDEIKALKKCMLLKMFPKNGEKVPEIRFPGFTDSWEQRKLGDIITEYKETVDSDCTLPILTSSKTEGVILQEEHFGRKQQHDITGYNILPRNYCTYRNRSDGVDFTFNINKCCDKGIISKFYPVFSGRNSDVYFLSLVLNNSEEVVREIAYTCTGTGQKVLSFLDLQKMKVRVPNFDEQKEIAAYFDSLDNLITLQERKCKVLQKLKKCMLQKMFV